jgi:hypothetical protein
MQRHMAKKARRAGGKHHQKGPSKRTAGDDKAFETAFRDMMK